VALLERHFLFHGHILSPVCYKVALINPHTKNQLDSFRHLSTIHQHHTQMHTNCTICELLPRSTKKKVVVVVVVCYLFAHSCYMHSRVCNKSDTIAIAPALTVVKCDTRGFPFTCVLAFIALCAAPLSFPFFLLPLSFPFSYPINVQKSRTVVRQSLCWAMMM